MSRLRLQITYNRLRHEIVVSDGRWTPEPIKFTKEQKEALRPVIQQRLKRTPCARTCCNCAFNGWSKTGRSYGAGCIKRQLTEAKTINQMRKLMNLAWGLEGNKPAPWK